MMYILGKKLCKTPADFGQISAGLGDWILAGVGDPVDRWLELQKPLNPKSSENFWASDLVRALGSNSLQQRCSNGSPIIYTMQGRREVKQ